MAIKELESCHNENTFLSINWNARYCLVFYIFWDLTVELFISNIGENLQFWVSTILSFEFVLRSSNDTVCGFKYTHIH